MTISLDGYAADADGDFQWSTPSDEVFTVHLDRIGHVSTEVMGHKTYTLMEYWETYPGDADGSADEHEFARRWRNIEKVVVSATMNPQDLVSDRARLVPRLSLDDLQQVVVEAPGVVEIFGPTTAAEAIRAGLIDVFEVFIVPKIVGGGLRALPEDVHLDLELDTHRTFDNGTTYLRYLPR